MKFDMSVAHVKSGAFVCLPCKLGPRPMDVSFIANSFRKKVCKKRAGYQKFRCYDRTILCAQTSWRVDVVELNAAAHDIILKKIRGAFRGADDFKAASGDSSYSHF